MNELSMIIKWWGYEIQSEFWGGTIRGELGIVIMSVFVVVYMCMFVVIYIIYVLELNLNWTKP